MTMTDHRPPDPATTTALAAPEYAVLDFNAPATIGIVLYECQRNRLETIATGEAIRSEVRAMEKSIRGDMAAMEKSIRGDMAAIENAIRADMVSMERSLREEIGRLSKNLTPLTVTLSAIAALAVFG